MAEKGFQYIESNVISVEIKAKPNKSRDQWAYPRTRKKNLQLALQYPNVLGAITLENISSGEFVVEYSGELISAERKEWRHNKSYMNEVIWGTELLYIDAAYCGNEARYLNHSCEPNCYQEQSEKKGLPVVCIYANQPIESGTFLTTDYCPTLNEFNWDFFGGRCLCRTASCKYRDY